MAEQPDPLLLPNKSGEWSLTVVEKAEKMERKTTEVRNMFNLPAMETVVQVGFGVVFGRFVWIWFVLRTDFSLCLFSFLFSLASFSFSPPPSISPSGLLLQLRTNNQPWRKNVDNSKLCVFLLWCSLLYYRIFSFSDG